jgi:hypothetical protein
LKRPYLAYLLAVVLPSALAVAAILAVAGSEWSEVRHASDARVAHVLLTAFEQDLGRATDSVVAAATATADADSTQPAVARALAGDTVTGIRPDGGAPEVFALTPPLDGDPVGSVRYAGAPLDGTLPTRIGRATGYTLSLYLNGRRWASTEEPAGPEVLPRAGSPPPAGALAALGGGAVTDAAVVALARRRDQVPGPVPVPLVLTIALLLLFAALSGWVQIAGRSCGDPPRRSRSMVLLAVIPALTAGAFMVQMDREFEARLREVDTGDLTVAGPAPALAALPTPPASLTATGRVVTQRGPSAYAARRTEAGAVLVATTPDASPRRARLRRRARGIAAVLAAWLLCVGVVYAVRGRRVSG